jgi:uncharacterized protein YgiM (DUF1202 family)
MKIIFTFLFLPLFAFAQSYLVNSSDAPLKLRESRSTKSEILKELKHGTVVTLVKKDEEEVNNRLWYKINSDGTTGYVAARYLIQSGVVIRENESKWIVTSKMLNLRSKPDLGEGAENIIETLSKDTKVTLLEKQTTNADGYTWFKVSYGDRHGYVTDQHLICEGDLIAKGETPIINKLDLTKKKQGNQSSTSKPKPANSTQSKNETNEKYWNDGKVIINKLCTDIDKCYIEKTFLSDVASERFKSAAKKIRALDVPKDVYPEIYGDVVRKTQYLDFVATTVDGSFSKYGEQAIAYLVSEAIGMIPELLMKKGFMPSSKVIWLSDDRLKTLESKLDKINDQEASTIEKVSEKYGLILVPW